LAANTTLSASVVAALCVTALALVGGALFAAVHGPQVYLLRLDDRLIQRAMPNQDPREVYAGFVGDVLTGAFTFNGYTAEQSESFLARYAEEPAAYALARIRQRAFTASARPQSTLAIRNIQIDVQRGLPVALVEAQWTWGANGTVTTLPLKLRVFLTSIPSPMAHHYRLSILTAGLVTP
jgi:hypothetical protein